MKIAAIPADEAARLASLAEYEILDTGREASFDALTTLAAELLDMPIALVSIVESDRQWFKSRYGIDFPESPRDASFCAHVVASEKPLVVSDALTDPRFSDNPLVLGEPRMRFYAGIPLKTHDGFVIGTLCAIDRQPRQLTPRQLELLAMLAGQVVDLLELRRQKKLLAQDRATLEVYRRNALEQQNELAASEARLRALFEGMSEGVVLQDANATITASNPAAARILGLTEDQLAGRSSVDPSWHCVHADGSPFPGATHPSMVTLRTGKPSRNGLMGIHKPSGELTWVSINVEPLANQSSTSIVTTFREITEQRASEEERDRLRERLVRQDRLVTTGTLAAGVAHEINNPLSFVSANLDLAIEELEELEALGGNSPSERIRELLQMLGEARDGAERIRRIVRGLRSLAREDSAPSPLEVARSIEQSIHLAMHELRQKATITHERSPVPSVLADDSRLSQVLVNLLVNAAQAFTDNDASKNRVTVRASLGTDNRVEIAVSDNGPGIAADVLPRIFDPFFTTKELGQGIGLGLSISHSIVTSLGGELTCETKLGQGSTFRVWLPIAEALTEPEVTIESLPSKRRGRILVVDDEPAVLRAIKRLLSADHEIVAVSDPREALGLFERSEAFDLVFCDLMMPHLTGVELYDRVRTLSPRDAERFVFISGGIIDERMNDLLADITNERVEKPFSPQNMRGIARRFVGN